jgi:hypothetical protein
MYLLNTKPITSLGCPLNAVRGPVPQDASRCRNTFALATANFKPITNLNYSA